MLTTTGAFSGYSVDDHERALSFYRDTLGLPVRETRMGGFELDVTGGAAVFVYAKGEAHTPASHTVLNLVVPDIDVAVAELADAGIALLRYPEMEDQDDDGIVRSTDPGQGPTIAWFADPAGNVISVLEGGR